jgi:hypothetical protein
MASINTSQLKLGNNGKGRQVSTNVRRQPIDMGMAEEVDNVEKRLPAPKKRGKAGILAQVMRLARSASVAINAATYSRGLNTNEEAELKKLRASAPTLSAGNAQRGAARIRAGVNNGTAVTKPVKATVKEPVKATVKEPVKATGAATTSAAAKTPTKFVGQGLRKAGMSVDGGMSDRVSNLGTVTSNVMKADLTDASLKKAGLAASNKNASKGFAGSFKRLFEGNIDQAGSAAYKKYGAGRGLSELLKKPSK